ncbi:MAG: helix-turn-helix domain-containing protein [Firmicutes bacterium]|nr:helix-turn-helix domain-containing protein [Bacillota bacterium]
MDFQHVPPAILDRLLALTKRLTARRDLDGLLHDILEGSMTLIPGSDFACVFLYRAEENALVPIGGVGFDMQYMKDVWLKPGESMTGKAFVQKRPLLLPNPQAIQEAQMNLSEEHQRLVKLAVGRPSNPVRSSLAVPLRVDQRTVGVLVIDNYDTDRDFDTVDLTVAVSLADHAAVAVLNAEDYQRAHAFSEELQETMALQQRLLASMMSPEGGLPDLINTLWTILRRPLVVHDAEMRVMVKEGGDMLEPQEFPIQTGSQILGSLRVGRGALRGRERAAIEQAIPLIALEFMKHQALEQERLHIQADAFHSIWNGDSEAAENLLRKYGLEGTDWQLMLVDGAPAGMLKSVNEWARTENIPITESQGAAILLVPRSLQSPLQRRLAEESHGTVFWGNPRQGTKALTTELRALVRLARSAPLLWPNEAWEPHRVHLGDFPEFMAFDAIPSDVKREYSRTVLNPLNDDGVLLRTVRTWIFQNRSYERTAQALHTHPNTIRYRLDKVFQLLGATFPDDHVVMQLRLAFLWSIEVRL